MVLGTVSDWLEQIERWRKLFNVEWFVLRCRIPMGPEPQRVLECIQRLGEEVLPKLRKS
jgi:hypothetical protein